MTNYIKTLEEGLKEFDDKFPAMQDEPTHFDECKCWSCNNYREEVISFLTTFAEKIRESVVGECRKELREKVKELNKEAKADYISFMREGTKTYNEECAEECLIAIEVRQHLLGKL